MACIVGGDFHRWSASCVGDAGSEAVWVAQSEDFKKEVVSSSLARWTGVKVKDYHITVVTGKDKNAGTTANVNARFVRAWGYAWL